jgi:DNA-binding GntR family transcriptional regulator
MTSFSQIQPVNLCDQVVSQVRTAIIEGRLKSGDHIVEKDLTSQLGVSRTPVREALLLLEQDGLITSIPNRGSFVRIFSEDDVRHIFSMRTMLENFTGELIIDELNDKDFAWIDNSMQLQTHCIASRQPKELRRVDMDFHRYLVERSNHPLVIQSWLKIVAQIAAILYLRAEADPGYDEYRAIEDHKLIIQAYENRDIDELRFVNHQINNRVASVCCRSIKLLSE